MNLATIKPNRIIQRYVNDNVSWECNYWDNQVRKNSNSLKNLSKKKQDYTLSRHSKNKIKDSIQLLHQLSKPRTIHISPKKAIYNFRTSFVTLTLPTKQLHSDITIKKCLNNFLQSLRELEDLNNYVWKAELQKNQNIHFHLVIDKFISYQDIRRYWNNSIKKLGYINNYREKFKNMSLKEYAEYRNLSVSKAYNSYKKGCDTNWSNPPTEQVISVTSKGQLANYLSKYLGKSINDKNDESIDIDRVQSFGRMWSRSQSISKIKLVSRWNWEELLRVLNKFGNVEKYLIKKSYDYCVIYYFNFKKLPRLFKKFINRIFNDLGKSYNYSFN